MSGRPIDRDDFDEDLVMSQLRWDVMEAQRRQAAREHRLSIPHPLGPRPVKSPERNVIG